MARPWRIQFAGASYHVTARGNRKQDIFLDDGDRRDFIGLLGRASERYRLRIHALCLMSNHYHLFLRTPEPNLAEAMKWLNGTYTNHFNRRHDISGHLFQGRYKSVLVTDEAHWLHLSIYIHLNPVRAGIAASPAQYQWSSYIDYTRKKPRFEWLCHEDIISQYGSGPAARKRYRAAVDMNNKKSAGFWKEFWDGMENASKETIKSLAVKNPPAGDPATVPDYLAVKKDGVDLYEELAGFARAFGVKVDELLARRRNFAPRRAAYYYLVEMRRFKVAEAAHLMGVSSGAVSMGIRKFRQELIKNKKMAEKMKSIIMGSVLQLIN